MILRVESRCFSTSSPSRKDIERAVFANRFFVALPVSGEQFRARHERNKRRMAQERDDFQDIVRAISSKFTILELSLPEIRRAAHDQLICMQKR